MASEHGNQTVTIHILPNISRTKGNQTTELSQLIGSNMKNIFLEKGYRKCGGEAIPRSFSNKAKLSIYLDQHLFLFHANLGAIEI